MEMLLPQLLLGLLLKAVAPPFWLLLGLPGAAAWQPLHQRQQQGSCALPRATATPLAQPQACCRHSAWLLHHSVAAEALPVALFRSQIQLPS